MLPLTRKERVVSYLTEELVRIRHDVTLFASGDSKTEARLVAGCDLALLHDPNCRETLPHHVRLMELLFRGARKFDVIHFHCDYLYFPHLRCVGLDIPARTGSLSAASKARGFCSVERVILAELSNRMSKRRAILGNRST